MTTTVLCFETSGDHRFVSLGHGTTINSLYDAAQKHNNQLLEHAKTLLCQAALSLSDLDAIAFSKGPGSFTGIRIGCCLASGLGYSLSLPVIGLSSLQIIAYSAFIRLGCHDIVVINDARMAQVYWAHYRITSINDISCIQPDQLSSPEAVTIPSNIPTVIVGSGWNKYSHSIPTDNQQLISHHNASLIDPEAFTQLARRDLSGQPHPALQAQPAYVRMKVAT